MDCLIKFVSQKSGITDSTDNNFGEVKIDSYNSLPIEKIVTFHNVIIISHLLIRIKVTTTIIYFKKKIRIKINSIQDIFK